MTKEELAKKKGLKVKTTLTPAENLVFKPKEPPKDEKPIIPQKAEEKPQNKVGRPKKHKRGDKKFSLWIDEDLVPKLYSKLSYGDTASELINTALREYLNK